MVAEGAYTARVTVDEWRALERISDVKHEYKDGHLYAMAGGSQTHPRIAVNAIAALDAALGDGPCMVYNSDMATRIFERRYTYPDVVVRRSVSSHRTGPGVVPNLRSGRLDGTKQYRRAPTGGRTLPPHRRAGDIAGMSTLIP